MNRWLFLAALFIGGCGDDDPCRGKPAVCIGVHVTGSATLDGINVVATLPTGKRLLGQAADLSPPTFVPPVQFALLLPIEAVGPVGVELTGIFLDTPLVEGSGMVTVPRSGRASLRVDLGPLSGDLGGRDLTVPQESSDLGASVDSALAVPLLMPPQFSFAPTLVGRSSMLTLTFTNPRATDVVISDVLLVPGGPPFGIEPGGSCAPAQAVAPNQSCTVVVSFQPGQRGMVSAELRVTFGADGEASSFLDGLGVAWLAEGLEQDAGVVPSFNALWGTSLDDVWTGGDHSTLFHRTRSGWGMVAPPASATTVNALWGPTVNDLWLASNASELDHTVNGSSWNPFVFATGNFRALFGFAADVYAADASGNIFHFNGTSWPSERTGDGTPLIGLWGSSAGNLYAVGPGNKILHRVPGGTWSAVVTVATGDHHAVWGASADDVWIVGCDLSGSTCGFIKHYDNGTFTRFTAPATDALQGVWGSSANDVFAVGKGGAILRFDGTAWSAEPSGTTSDLNAVWGDSGEVFAVGVGGTILHRY